eukprot:2841335-Pyramimonas_sp.AAC.2
MPRTNDTGGYSNLTAILHTYSVQAVSNSFSMSNSASEIGTPRLAASSAVTSLNSAALEHEEPRIAASSFFGVPGGDRGSVQLDQDA